MGKTSPLTGTGKKAQKKLYKAQGTQAEMSTKQLQHDQKYRKSSQYDLRQIAKGEHGLTSSLSELQDKFKRAGKGAEKIFAPIKEEALANFDQYTTPEITNQFGRESGSGSSALNQAMAGARVNLQRSLASDFAGLQSNLAQNMLGQSEQNKLSNLNARMQANSGLMGQPIQPVFGGLQSSYNAPQQKGPSALAGAAGGLAQGAGTVGTLAALSHFAPALLASSREVKENIKDYEKGLEVLKALEVKQYDYTVPVEGRQTNRVGLIAEDLPEEIQGMIGDIKAVDVYGLVSLLVNCVKQLDEKVKVLEAKYV